MFARKWSRRLPIATPCVIVDRGGSRSMLLANAEQRAQSDRLQALSKPGTKTRVEETRIEYKASGGGVLKCRWVTRLTRFSPRKK